MEPIRLLVNPQSGAGAALAAAGQVEGLIRARGHDVDRIQTENQAHTVEVAAADDSHRIIVLGGDGMFHHVLQGVAGSGRPVGLVPVGTGNDFARALDLPRHDLSAAVDVALGPVRPFDAVRTEAGWFATIATFGISATVNARGNAMKWPKGDLRYTIATLIELPRASTEAVELEIDGQVSHHEANFVAIANTRFFGGGMDVCPDAEPGDGLLEVGVVGPAGRFELLRMFPKLFDGGHVDHPAFTSFTGRRVTLRSDHVVRADGEPLGDSPLVFEAVPAALEMAAGSL
ncbi:MAG: diacylglycerol kinase family lipid kinase [Actinomycetia bacterium]|nr:diacylglycerol kinase family lipid kinase [Actinomycetes bacterium]